MKKATTVLSPREVMMRIKDSWWQIFKDINSHYKVGPKGKVMLDKKMVNDIRLFAGFEKKLEDAALKQILDDAKIIGEGAKKNPQIAKEAKNILKQIETILKDFKKEEFLRMRQAFYLRRLASRLRGNIRRIKRSVDKEGKKLMKKWVQTKRKKISGIKKR